MTIFEKQGNLFDMPSSYMLAHCISADYAMGAGIAKEFAKRGAKEYLKSNYPEWNKLFAVGYCLRSPLVGFAGAYNLVTKDRYWQKPTYQTLREALVEMAEEAVRDGVKHIAMPKIGCGLDRLEWQLVKTIIESVFANTDVEIVVCSL